MENLQLLECKSGRLNTVPCAWLVDDEASVAIRGPGAQPDAEMIAGSYDREKMTEKYFPVLLRLPFKQLNL